MRVLLEQKVEEEIEAELVGIEAVTSIGKHCEDQQPCWLCFVAVLWYDYIHVFGLIQQLIDN
jgi:hypothetical protein